MMRAIVNKSWRQYSTKQQLYGHLPPIMRTIKVRRTRHGGHCWRSKDELISNLLLWTPSHSRAKAGRPARTYIQLLCEDTGVALRTCRKWWTIGKGGERGSVISVLMAWQNDDDNEDLVLNNLQWLICHKTQPNQIIYIQYICIKRIWHWLTYNGC